MRRLISFGILSLASIVSAQTITFTDATTVRTMGASPAGVVLTHDGYNSILPKNLLWGDPGFEPAKYSALIQVGVDNAGKTTYFNTFNQFADYATNDLFGGTYNDIRQGVSVCNGIVSGLNGGTSSNPTQNYFTAVLSGSTVGSVTINQTALDGIANGTYNARITNGGGTGAAYSFTISGATLGSGGYTGGTISQASLTAGTGYTSAPIITLMSGMTVSSCAASGGFSNGDYVIVRFTYAPTAQSFWGPMGWLTSTSGGGSMVGTSNVTTCTGDAPAGTSSTQSIQLDANGGTGLSEISQVIDNGGTLTSQNMVNLTGPMTVSVCAKTLTGTSTLHWQLVRAGSTYTGCSGTWTVTTASTVFTAGGTCSPAESSSTPQGALTYSLFNLSANPIILDNAYLADVTTQPTAFRDPIVTTLTAFGGGTRILDNQLTMPITQILQPDTRGESPYIFTENCPNAGIFGSSFQFCPNIPSMTLPMQLGLQKQIGKGDPWYVIPATTNMVDTTEAACLQDYMGDAAGATTCGAIRVAQGHAGSYLTEIAGYGGKFHAEDGNENWNSGGSGEKWLLIASGFGNLDYTPYGYASQSVFSAMRARPSFSLSTEDLVIGAQTCGNCSTFAMDALANPSTGITLAATTISQAPYTLGNPLSGGFTTTPEPRTQDLSALAEVQYNANNAASPVHIMANAGYTGFNIDIYEFNNGTQSAGTANPTTAQLTGFADGEGYGLVNAISVLENCYAINVGCRFQGFFQFLQQSVNIGSGINPIWGGWIGSGAQTNNNVRPGALSLQALNAAIPSGASMIQHAISSNPTFSFAGANGTPANAAVPYLYAYGFKKTTNRTYVLINSDCAANHTATLSGVAISGTVTRTIYNTATSGCTGIADTNAATSPLVTLTTTSTAMPTSYALPMHSMTVFSGSTITAGNWYVLKGATGAGTGADWTNAWTDLSSINWTSVQCGDTVWIGGGSYTTSATVTKTCTSGSPLLIQSVLSTDTVPTSAAGYTTAVLNQVLITQNSFDIDGAYITLSGRKGTPGTGSSFGIKFLCTTSCVLSEVGTSANSSNITESYLYMQGPPCVFDNGGGSGIGSCTNPVHAIQHGSATVANMVMDHLWLSGFAETIQLYQWTNWMLQYSQVDTIGQTVNEHEDLIYAANPSDGTIRYSTFFSSPNDGIFFDFGGNSLTFYRNVMYHLGGAAITFKAGYTNGSFIAYNNTFSSDTTYGDFRCPSNCPNVITQGTPTTLVFKNNIFDHVGIDGGAGSTSNYNAFSTDIGKDDSGANSFTYTSAFPPSNTQFINISTSTPQASNYRLTSTGITAFAPGTALGTPYNVDMDGNVAPVSGAWEIGAYQNTSASSGTTGKILGNGVILGLGTIR